MDILTRLLVAYYKIFILLITYRSIKHLNVINTKVFIICILSAMSEKLASSPIYVSTSINVSYLKPINNKGYAVKHFSCDVLFG